jgi:hypothetical protein
MAPSPILEVGSNLVGCRRSRYAAYWGQLTYRELVARGVVVRTGASNVEASGI